MTSISALGSSRNRRSITTIIALPVSILIALLLPAPHTASGAASLAWTASISPDSTVTTAQFDVAFTGLDANSAVQLTLQPTNLVVGDQFSTAQGTAQFSFKVPSTTQPGDYSIRAVGISNSGNAFTITVATFTVASTGIINDSTVRDGVLTLEIPTGASATFAEPALENGVSVTRGSLGAFSVRDDRSVSRPGWILTASVSVLTLSTNNSITMGSGQLGIDPRITAGGSGVNAGQDTVAGSAVYPFVFAEAPAGVQASSTTVNADLTLMAPPHLPVGTYTGTITVTLMSR